MINVKNKSLIKTLGKRIKDLREQKELSQEQLAHEADIPISQIGRIERGETNPTISTLFVIANALSIDLPELLNFKSK